MSAARIVFLDTETTSLRPDRRAWEVGLIIRDPGKDDQEWHRFIRAADLDLGNADPFSLKVGRFYERHPDYAGGCTGDNQSESFVLQHVERLTRGAYLAGNVVNFDADVLGARMRAHGLLPAWNYHLVDVEALAAGWLSRHAAHLENTAYGLDAAAGCRQTAVPPWDSELLSVALDVKVPEEDRHTALGDARWARALFDAVTGRMR